MRTNALTASSWRNHQVRWQQIPYCVAQAKQAGARYRVGPELELPGYGCEDHFLEPDTISHSWEALGHILQEEACNGILVDVGMPVVHRGVRYNCRAFVLDGRVLLLRPKMHLADDGNYREGRYFTTWKRNGCFEEHRCATIGAACCNAASNIQHRPVTHLRVLSSLQLWLDVLRVHCSNSAFAHAGCPPRLRSSQGRRSAPLATQRCSCATVCLPRRRARSCSRLWHPTYALRCLVRKTRHSAYSLSNPEAAARHELPRS